MKVMKKVLCICLCICLMFDYTITVKAVTGSAEKETTLNENKLYAQSAVLMDAESGRILYSKNGDEQKPMASTTKIMTCIVALENGNLEDVVTVSKYAASMPDVQLNIREGEQYLLRDLLYSLMLESHNDSAVAIAEHIGGGEVLGFADLMNKKAKEIGCKDTFFITPNGLDATVTFTTDTGEKIEKTHCTTAEDLARIMSYCITDSPMKEEFIKITSTQSYQFQNKSTDDTGQVISGGRSFSCNNHNAFLSMMDGALTGKTGFTGKAGYCYVGALRRDNRTFVVALLACGWPNNKGYKWSDTRQLMNYGLDNYEYRSFNRVKVEEDGLQPIVVDNGQTDRIGGTAYTAVKFKETGDAAVAKDMGGILLQKDEEIRVNCKISKSLEAPVTAGTVVGNIQYIVEDEVYWEDTIIAADDIPVIDFKWCLTKIIGYYGI